MSTPTITASQVKELRDKTGAGMMDCKAALTETGGDIDAAVELLRVKLGDKALKMGGREATEGTVQAYIHTNGKTGVLVEVDCNRGTRARPRRRSRRSRRASRAPRRPTRPPPRRRPRRPRRHEHLSVRRSRSCATGRAPG